MTIKELYIENFGKLSQYKKVFSDGLNSFTEDNGYGKTTITVFIKTMLYGFDDSRKHSLDENDRKKYTPWQGGAFGGWLVFEAAGKRYRVERSFQTKGSDDTFALFDLDTGLISQDFSSSLGEELFGIDSDGFERTVFLSEKNLSGKNTNQTISAKLSNLVGTEGDIGGFDAAIKLLDDRRRFYQKKGGAGEIQDLRRSISELEEEIRVLYLKKDGISKSEKEISAIAESIKSLRLKKDELQAKERSEALAKEQRGYEIQYSEMLGNLKVDEKRESELLDFFAKKIPTNAEIASSAESESEIKRLKHRMDEIGENHELSSLKSFFTRDTSAEECEKMMLSAKKVAEERAALYTESSREKIKSPFLKEPSIRELDTLTARLANGKPTSHKSGEMLLATVGLLVVLAGILLGTSINPILYSIAAVGALLIIVSILSIFRAKSNGESAETERKINDLIYEAYGEKRQFDSPLTALMTIRADLEKLKLDTERIALLEREREASRERVERIAREVREFCESYPLESGLTPEEATLEIARKRRRYEMLSEFESGRDTDRAVCRERIKELEKAVSDFVSLFPISTNDPINEIRKNLAEFEVLRSSLSRRRSDAERFALAHNVRAVSQNTVCEVNTGTGFSHELASLEEQIISLEREKSRLEPELSTLIREVERIDELEGRVREKSEQAELFASNLWVITKAKEMLAKSKDNMTARYLDTTKQGFDKYIRLIDGDDGDFTIDTSFTVSKNDLGKSRQQEAYSRGTRELHSLAIRLALTDALYEGEKPPVILDDPFVSFDDAHVERALSVVKRLALDRQIFYFTCSRSRKAK